MPGTVTDPTPRMVNEAVFRNLDENATPEQTKRAADAINEFVRMRMREDGFWRRILPPLQITNDELDKAVDTDKPVKIISKEPNSPAAVTLPFASLPSNRYIRSPKIRMMFDRIATPKFMKDIDELRTYDFDIRQVLSDNAIKDMLAEEDGKAVATVNSILGPAGVPGFTVPETNQVQWLEIAAGICRESVTRALQIMPSTPAHLRASTALINNVSVMEFMKWGRDEIGGDLAEEIVRNGYSEETFMGIKWIVTIKRNLVPDNVVFFFADPKFLGKTFILQDTTLVVKREAYMLEFWAYESMSSCIANVAGIAKATFVA